MDEEIQFVQALKMPGTIKKDKVKVVLFTAFFGLISKNFMFDSYLIFLVQQLKMEFCL